MLNTGRVRPWLYGRQFAFTVKVFKRGQRCAVERGEVFDAGASEEPATRWV